MEPPSALRAVFADRNFQLFTAGAVISWNSFFVQTVAVSWLAWHLTKSAAWVGAISLLELVPYFLFGPLGSALADRVDRFKIQRVTSVLIMLMAAGFAVICMLGLENIWLLAALVFAQGVVWAFGVPAGFGLLPRAVPAHLVSTAIAVNAAYRTLAMFSGPAIAGLMLTALPVAWSFAFNTAGYCIFIAALWLMKMDPQPRRERPTGKGLHADFLDGLRHAARHDGFGRLMLLGFFSDGLARLFLRMLPVFADQTFHRGAEGLAMLVTASGIGAAGMALYMAQLHRRSQVAPLAVYGFAGSVAAAVLFVMTGSFPVALATRFIFGALSEAAVTGTDILIQSNVPDEFRSRVMGSRFLISQAGAALSFVAVSLFGDRIGLAGTVLGYTAVAGIAALVLIRDLPRLRAALPLS